MSDLDAMRTHFSTKGMFAELPLEQAARAFRDFCAEHFCSIGIEVRDDERFHASFENLPIDGNVSVARVAVNAERIARTVPMIAADADDRLTLLVNTTGKRCVVRQCGRDLAHEPGTATLFSQSHPVEFLDLPPTPCLQVVMNREILALRVVHLEDRLAVEAGANPDAMRLLTNYARLLLDSGQGIGHGPDKAISSHLVDLAALVLGAVCDSAAQAQEHGVRAARLAAVLDHVATEYSDARLSAAVVAARLGVTPRYVHLLLDESGQSFSQHLMERRLAAARDLLADPKQLHRKISDIAYAVGFTDVSHFNRSFRARYGLTPSDVRARAIRGLD
jgi:AraC-like DNA-binding protein